MKKLLFVPRAKAWIEDANNSDGGIGQIGTLKGRMGVEDLLTLDFTGKFNIDKGGYLYVFPGHGTAGSGTAHWVKAGDNLLTAETVAQLTAERFPDCTDVSIKIYACHSSEGGYNSFANRFARAFRPDGGTYDVTIFGYRGSVTTGRKTLGTGDIQNSEKFEWYKTKINPQTNGPLYAIPKDFTGPAASVVVGATHRWSKVATPVYASRASEARDKVAWLKAVKGTVWQRWGV